MSEHAEEGPVASAIRVLLAEHHALLSSALRRLLDAEDDIEVVAEADDLEAVVRHIDDRRPDVLVFDLGMIAGSPHETIGGLRARAPELQVVLLTMDDNPQVAQHLLACGAQALVLKDRADDELTAAVRAAARGEDYVSRGVASRLDGASRDRVAG
jgi:two-component system response regulator NreC